MNFRAKFFFSFSVAKLSTANIEERKGSIFDQNIGPPLDQTQLRNYKTIEQILIRMNRLCVDQNTGKERPHEQLLLRNMGVHTVVLDLLQIPYDQKEDILMNEIIKLAHEFLQNFCLKYSENQVALLFNFQFCPIFQFCLIFFHFMQFYPFCPILSIVTILSMVSIVKMISDSNLF